MQSSLLEACMGPGPDAKRQRTSKADRRKGTWVGATLNAQKEDGSSDVKGSYGDRCLWEERGSSRQKDTETSQQADSACWIGHSKRPILHSFLLVHEAHRSSLLKGSPAPGSHYQGLSLQGTGRQDWQKTESGELRCSLPFPDWKCQRGSTPPPPQPHFRWEAFLDLPSPSHLHTHCMCRAEEPDWMWLGSFWEVLLSSLRFPASPVRPCHDNQM